MSDYTWFGRIVRLGRMQACLMLVVTVIIGCGRTNEAMNGAPSETKAAATNSMPGVAVGASYYQYSWDSLDCSALAGWAWDRNDPGAALKIDVFADGERISTLTANGPRPDLARGGMGSGNYQFEMPIPESLKGGTEHAILLKISGTDITLPPPGSGRISCAQ